MGRNRIANRQDQARIIGNARMSGMVDPVGLHVAPFPRHGPPSSHVQASLRVGWQRLALRIPGDFMLILAG
jgi:hypothetical protein